MTTLSHSDYWRLQAQATRLAAQRIEDPEAREDLLAKADEYDRFAACNREWEIWLPTAGQDQPSPRHQNDLSNKIFL